MNSDIHKSFDINKVVHKSPHPIDLEISNSITCFQNSPYKFILLDIILLLLKIWKIHSLLFLYWSSDKYFRRINHGTKSYSRFYIFLAIKYWESSNSDKNLLKILYLKESSMELEMRRDAQKFQESGDYHEDKQWLRRRKEAAENIVVGDKLTMRMSGSDIVRNRRGRKFSCFDWNEEGVLGLLFKNSKRLEM